MNSLHFFKKTFKVYRKLLYLQSKKMSTNISTNIEPRIIYGSNGERIIKSPYGNFEYSGLSITEYVLGNTKNYEKLIAIVGFIIISL